MRGNECVCDGMYAAKYVGAAARSAASVSVTRCKGRTYQGQRESREDVRPLQSCGVRALGSK